MTKTTFTTQSPAPEAEPLSRMDLIDLALELVDPAHRSIAIARYYSSDRAPGDRAPEPTLTAFRDAIAEHFDVELSLSDVDLFAAGAGGRHRMRTDLLAGDRELWAAGRGYDLRPTEPGYYEVEGLTTTRLFELARERPGYAFELHADGYAFVGALRDLRGLANPEAPAADGARMAASMKGDPKAMPPEEQMELVDSLPAAPAGQFHILFYEPPNRPHVSTIYVRLDPAPIESTHLRRYV